MIINFINCKYGTLLDNKDLNQLPNHTTKEQVAFFWYMIQLIWISSRT